MTMPSLPAQGNTNWRGWASAVHDAATEVIEGRLTEAELRAKIEGVVVHDGTAGGGTRPTGYARVRWIGGTTRPTNMATGDVWEHDA